MPIAGPIQTSQGVSAGVAQTSPSVDVTAPQVLNGSDGRNALISATAGVIIHATGAIYGGDGNDQLYGGSGNDTLDGGAGDDMVDGGAGDDLIATIAGFDTIVGGAGNDNIRAVHTPAQLYGDDGDDLIEVYGYVSESGPSTGLLTIDGGAGSDTIRVHFRNDSSVTVQAKGGSGSDTFILSGASMPEQLAITDFSAADGDILDLRGMLPPQDAYPVGMQGYLWAEQVGNDTVIWYDRDSWAGSEYGWERLLTLPGVQLSDLTELNFAGGLLPFRTDLPLSLQGNYRAERLMGGTRDDLLNGGDGDDTLDGGTGNDTLNGGSGDDILRDDQGKNVLHGGYGNDQLFGGSGNDWLIGGAYGDDLLEGGAGVDYLQAWGAGNDTLFGGAGDDQLEATESSGQLYGGDGDDWIQVLGSSESLRVVSVDGGAGNDQLHILLHGSASVLAQVMGGTGKDTFAVLFSSLENSVTIGDFSVADGDVLELRDMIPKISGHPYSGLGYVHAEQEGSDTVIWFDRDGPDGHAYAWQRLLTLTGVDRTQLTFANFQDGLDIHNLNAAVKLDAADILIGGMSADTLSGGLGDDWLVGGEGNDYLDGGDGNDTLQGETGNDMMDGGAGLDIAYFAGDASLYFWSQVGEALVVQAKQGSAGMDVLLNVERIRFAGSTIAFDVGADGSAGEVYRLYQAAFGRTPDTAGLAWWIKAADGGMSLTQMSTLFMQSSEFASLYGATPDSAALVRALYLNALHREPDDAGVAYWTQVLDKGYASPEAVLIGFSESAENQESVAKVIGAGIDLGPWT